MYNYETETYKKQFNLNIYSSMYGINTTYYLYNIDVCLSQNGSLILFINPEQVRNNYLYKRQFRQLSLITESQVNTLSK